MAQIIHRTLGIWLCFILISLPFPLDWLPSIGEFISSTLKPITVSFASLIELDVKFSFSSDSTVYYTQSLLLLPIALTLSIIIHRYKLINEELMHRTVAYILAFFLLKYGVIKLFQSQFYQTEPNIAYTPVGYLSKDLLFWTSTGSSALYNYFMGGIEVITAALLLWWRTRFLGTVMSVGVFLNILILNLSFDISVKLLASTLFFSSLFLLWNYRQNLWRLFISHEPILKKIDSHQNYTIVNRAIIGSVIALFVFENLYIYVKPQKVSPFEHLVGSYEVIDNENNHLFNSIRRIHFHSQGYLVTEDSTQHFVDYKYYPMQNGKRIYLNEENIQLDVLRSEGELNLILIENNAAKVTALRKLNNDTLPIYEDGFHWTFEGMIKN